MSRDTGVLVVLVGIAAALRLRALDVQSLWHDELFVWYAAELGSLADAVRVGAVEDVHPPGYVALIFAWRRLFGDSEIALRMPSVLAGIVSVGWIARLGAAWLSPRAGQVAAALTAVSWMPIYYSQEGRPYSLLFLGTIVLAERITAFRGRWVEAGVVAAVAVAVGYLHYFGLLFVVCALSVWGGVALVERRDRGAWAAVCGVTAVAILPWVATILKQTGKAAWIPMPRGADVWSTFGTMANDAPVGLAVVSTAGALAWVVRRGAWNRAVPLLVAWAAVPVIAALAVSWLVLPVYTARNLIIVLPAVLLLAAGALTQLDGRVPLATATVLGLLGFDLFWVRDYYHRPTKWQYRQVVEAIVETTPAGARPSVVSGAWHPSYFDYYFQRLDSPIRVDATAHGRGPIERAVQRASSEVIYVTVPIPGPRRRRGTLVLEGYDLDRGWQLVGWDLYRFVRNE